LQDKFTCCGDLNINGENLLKQSAKGHRQQNNNDPQGLSRLKPL